MKYVLSNFWKVPIYLFTVLCLCTSCAGSLYVEKSKDYKSIAPNIKKVVSIEPRFVYSDIRRPQHTQLAKSAKKELEVSEVFVKNAKKNGIDLKVYDVHSLKKSDVNFYNYLRPLAQNIIYSNLSQDVLIDKSRAKSSLTKPAVNEFEYSPRFYCDYSDFKEKFGTKYFALQGVVSLINKNIGNRVVALLFPPMAFKANANTYYYVIVVDVEKSEVVYREIREINERAFNNNLNSIVYDSFKIIKSKK